MHPTTRAYVELHIAVILFGFTAILGKLISISAVSIVWWRVLISFVSFFFIVNVLRTIRKLGFRQMSIFFGIGVLIGLHWITFYGSIKLSNASISLICLATTSFFTSFLEPLILKRPFYWYELLIGVFILPGMLLVVNGVDFSYRDGIVVGLLSALFATLFSILNKKYIDKASPMEISAIEMGAVWLFISIIAPFILLYSPETRWMPKGIDWFYLVLLSLLCTTLAYVLSMRALKHLSAFMSNLVVNLEPVYGILLAVILLSEHKELTPSFFAGVLIICVAVFSYPLIKRKFSKHGTT